MRIAVVDKMAQLRRREVESQRCGEFGSSNDPPSSEDDTSLNVTGDCHDCHNHQLSCRCSPGEG